MEQCNQVKFYGAYFSDNPTDFMFTLGERRQIKMVSHYIQDMIDRKGIESTKKYFESNSDYKQVDYDCNSSHADDFMQSGPKYFLAKLLNAAQRNSSRKYQGNRYDNDIKLFAAIIRMLAGPLAYSTISCNLRGVLPSLSATNKYIQKYEYRVDEGIFRAKQLKSYLIERNLPLIVSLSEDGTRISNRIEYDSKTNQVVGFVLPTCNKTGMPIPFSYPAKSAQDIINYFSGKYSVASNVNVVMAQPISAKYFPPFCLLLFGTDNKYTGRDVANRWRYMVESLESEGIKVLSISSDSDSKYNSAMRRLSFLGVPSNYSECSWFQCGAVNTSNISTLYIQDTPHILSKLRNFFLISLRDPDRYPFGRKYFIRLQHLQYLVKHFSKDKHNLTPGIVNPVDRQNFEQSVLRICDSKVTNLLRSSVVDSQATIKFLEIMRNIHDSFSNNNLSPIERVEKMWYSLFMIRIWRDYVTRCKNLKMKNNFLTTNCYACIELNAHAIVLLILHFQGKNTPELFLPHLLNSQACEDLFRIARGFTSTFSTVVNFSSKDFVHRISKIQMQNDIMQTISKDFEFPRLGKSTKNQAYPPQSLPTIIEIISQIEKCKVSALQDGVRLQLLTNIHAQKFDDSCKILPLINRHNSIINSDGDDSDNDGHNENVYEQQSIWKCYDTNCLRGTTLKNYAKNFGNMELEESSIYLEIFNELNKRTVVKKSSLVWLLRKRHSRISSDRLIRVRSTISKISKTRKKLNKNHYLHSNYAPYGNVRRLIKKRNDK